MANNLLTSRGIGHPDYAAVAAGIVAPKKPSSLYQPETQLSDMTELAARLGSPVTYDGRGDIIFLDDFRNGINRWYKTTADGVYSVTKLANSVSRSSGFCMGIGQALAQVNTKSVTLYLPFTTRGKMGLELHVSGSPHKTTITFEVFDEPLVYSTSLLLNAYAISVARLQTSGGVWEQISTGNEFDKYNLANNYGFTPIKMVVDFANSLYERILINGLSVSNASGKPIYTYANTTSKKYLKINLTREQAEQGEYVGTVITYLYVADVIVTINEPANS